MTGQHVEDALDLLGDFEPLRARVEQAGVEAHGSRARHDAMVTLAGTGLIFLSSIALSEYRHASSKRPSTKVESLIGRIGDKRSSGHYLELLRTCVGATDDGLIASAIATQPDAAARRLKAAIDGITGHRDAIAQGSETVVGVVENTTEQSGHVSWFDAWNQIVKYRNTQAHPEGKNWPFDNQHYHKLMEPILTGAIVEALALPALTELRLVTYDQTDGREITYRYTRARPRTCVLPVDQAQGFLQPGQYLFLFREREASHPIPYVPYLSASELSTVRPLVATGSGDNEPPPAQHATPPAGSVDVSGPWAALVGRNGLVVVDAQNGVVRVRGVDGPFAGSSFPPVRIGAVVTHLAASADGDGVVAIVDGAELRAAIVKVDGSLTWQPFRLPVLPGARLLAAKVTGDQWTVIAAAKDGMTTIHFDTAGTRSGSMNDPPGADAVAIVGDGAIRLIDGHLVGAPSALAAEHGPWCDVGAAGGERSKLVAGLRASGGGSTVHLLRIVDGAHEHRSFLSEEPLSSIVVAPAAAGRGPVTTVLGQSGRSVHWWTWSSTRTAR